MYSHLCIADKFELRLQTLKILFGKELSFTWFDNRIQWIVVSNKKVPQNLSVITG